MAEYIMMCLGFLAVLFFSWLLNSKKTRDIDDLNRNEEVAPLLGVVLPKKKDGTDE